MKRMIPIVAVLLVALSSLACTITIPALPDIDVPRLEVGPMQEYPEQVSRDGRDEARVEINMGVGDLTVAAGDADPLLDGQFRTNVVEWAPDIEWWGATLRIDQGSSEGIPDPGAENEWELLFSPEVALDMEINIGAGNGNLDLSGLRLSDLALQTGASDIVVHFDEPSPIPIENLVLRSGASSLSVDEMGNASPESVTVEGGVGNLVLDLTGAWSQSSRVRVTAGTGSVTLRFPETVGVRVTMEGGLGNIDADDGFERSNGSYVNSAYGQADIEVDVEVVVGVGNVNLELVAE